MEKQDTSKLTNAQRTKQSKTRIIQEANRLFAESGYYGTHMNDIAKASNLTLPGLLHHFANKEELLISVLENRDRTDQQYYESLFKNSSGMNPFDALSALVEKNQANPELVQMFTLLSAESITPGHPGHEFFVNRYRFFRQVYLSMLKEAQAQGKINPNIDAEQIGTLVMAILDGLQLQWLLDPEEVDMASVFKIFTRIFDQVLHEHE
jgi:AcrR family transcriptional regulator